LVIDKTPQKSSNKPMSSQNSSTELNNNNFLVITALGQDRPGLVASLTEAITQQQCSICESQMSLLGGEFAIIMLVKGQWNNIAKLEQVLPSLQENLKILIQVKQTEQRANLKSAIPYCVEVLALDNPGIVHQVTEFFFQRKINIHDMHTESFNAAHTGTNMFALNMTIEIPTGIHIPGLREDFLEFSDELNLDSLIEPFKTH